jgi:hypothetical protein
MQEKRHLNIISFDIPYPPDYGGVIDVFYKLKALADRDIKLHCHFFQYKDRKKSKELYNICNEVFYYKRNRIKNPFSNGYPYIVKTRQSAELLKNLNNNNYPILFEGLHTCFYINHKSLSNRKKIVRMHNIEHLYYSYLAKNETNILKKAFFTKEAKKLKEYLNILTFANKIAAISTNDSSYLHIKFPDKTFYLPVFHPNDNININLKKGDFALYNGNLSVNENIKAALFLINEVFYKINYKLIIAGKNPPKKLYNATKNKTNIEIISNPDNKTLQKLFDDAHIHILPTFQNTGIKLKLLNALFNGKFVIVNPPMIENTDLKDICIVAQNAEEMRKLILFYKNKIPNKAYIELRKQTLQKKYSTDRSAKILIRNFFDD